jgi:hypothetical protein
MGDQTSSPSQIIALPKGSGAQRGLGEKFSPELHTGTGNFTVPPGRNGFQPQLSLVYSTGNGNGLHGIGWALNVPGVTRKTSRGIPRYWDYDLDQARRDVFIRSGAEDLVPISDPSLDHRDHALSPAQRRVIHHHDATAGTNYWEVSSVDGLTSYYGSLPSGFRATNDTGEDPQAEEQRKRRGSYFRLEAYLHQGSVRLPQHDYRNWATSGAGCEVWRI